MLLEKQAEILTKKLLSEGFLVCKPSDGYEITHDGHLISKALDIKTFVTVGYAVLLTKIELKESA